MWLLTRPDVSSIRFGLTSAFLQQGTAANILKYFGLVWDTTNERWNYTSPSGGSPASSIATLGTLTGTREPDFFELLQAGILNGSLGDSLSIRSRVARDSSAVQDAPYPYDWREPDCSIPGRFLSGSNSVHRGRNYNGSCWHAALAMY